jgi:hypothetical protein
MHHFEIVYKGLSKSEPPEFPLRTATIFVRRGEARAKAFIAMVEEHGGPIIKNRVLVLYDGFSIDVELPDRASAENLLFDWWNYTRSEKGTLSGQ